MDDYKESVLSVYFNGRKDSGRFTSQDICDNLRDTASDNRTKHFLSITQ